MSKHYIRKDENKIIIKVFSDAFEKPLETDICINENGGRHYHLDIFDENIKHNYKYVSSKITERTEAEKWPQEELDNIEKEKLIAEKISLLQREQAVQSLKDENKLDENENLIK